jgi:hypothetical protein
MHKRISISILPPVPKKEINQDHIDIPLDAAARKYLTSRVLLALDRLHPTSSTGVNDSFGALDALDDLVPIRTFLSFCCDTSGIEAQLTEPFRSVVVTLRAMSEQVKVNPVLQPILQNWETTVLTTQAVQSLRVSLTVTGKGWGARPLAALGMLLVEETQSAPVVRVRIRLGKVVWRVRDSQGMWWAPNGLDKKMGTQFLRRSAESALKEPSDAVDFSVEDFVRFKRAGKRRAAFKTCDLGQGKSLERRRIQLADNTPFRRWDVGPYDIPVSAGLHRDHLPQDKWLFKAYHHYDGADNALKLLNKVSEDTLSDKTIRKHIAMLGAADMSIKGLFPVLNCPIFQTLVEHSGQNFKKKDAAALYKSSLQTFQHVAYPQINSYTKQLKNKESEISNTALVIAVPREMHVHSRTYNMKISDDRKTTSVSQELVWDMTHYFQTKETKDYFEKESQALAAMGAFRYLYKQTVKKYALVSDAHTQYLDASMLSLLKHWKQVNG